MSNPLGLGPIVSEILKGLDMNTRVKEQMCILAWDAVVGKRIASAAQPEFIRDGRLFVVTKSSVWANELTFHKQDIMEKLNREVGANAVKEIIFRTGRLAPKDPDKSADTEELDSEGIPISDSELEQLEAAAKDAGLAADMIKGVLATSLRFEKWKEAHGWKPCSRCGALQNTTTELCPICRMNL